MHATYASPQLESDRFLFSRVGWRILPFLFILYLFAYLDRVNVSFAGLQMRRDLAANGFTDFVFGFGGGIFFLGYALFEIPSNLILERVGARAWICRIMLTWGIVSACMMLVRGPRSFYLLRMLLGVAEAGFFPGMLLYLTYWFPGRRRARAVALFMTATAASGVIGAPISALFLSMDGVWHLHGWQWLFLAEGIPAILLGLVVLWILPDNPRQARWLGHEDRLRIEELLEAERPRAGSHHSHDFASAVLDRRVWLLTVPYCCVAMGLYCVSLWLPQILKQIWPGHADWQVSLMSGIPYAAAVVGMIAIGLHSDHTGERRWHFAGSLMLGCIGAVGAALLSRSPLLTLISLSVAAIGIWSAFGPFWAMPSAFLGGTAAAGGIALINSIGCIGGWIGPTLVGKLREKTGSFTAGLWMVAAVLFFGALVALCVRLPASEPAREAESVT